LDNVKQRQAVKQFVSDWTGRGDEKQDAQNFWRQLLQKVFGVEDPEKAISFEYKVKNDQTKTTIFIDAYIHDTHVLIEQKSCGINLKKGYPQSDGSILSPFQQARRYAGLLPHNMNPRWIVVCNFQEFHIHNMNQPNAEPEIVKLADLEKEYTRLEFLVDSGSENLKKEMEISIKAGEIVGVLYDALYEQYKEPDSERAQKSLNALCVRLVFCLYAEDAGIFGKRLMFHDYMKHRGAGNARQALIDLFRVLDQKPEERDPYLDDDLAAFPYVNGGLFSDENIEIPRITDKIYQLILRNASENFDWSEISPTIFGAVFESTLNPETRRKGGMHYTSIENIHKVIDPLFLDDLKTELEEILKIGVVKTRTKRLEEFQNKLAALRFFDPACGSGNFLTETYLSLRRLENEVIAELARDQITMGDVHNPIKLSIQQFYGIEINDFAVSVAKTAMWIAESQMLQETKAIIYGFDDDFLPLKTYVNIVEGNALRIDWESVVPRDKLSYIMGNPPFVGYSLQSSEQKADLASIMPEFGKNIDYVAGWYLKSAELMRDTNIRTALVSTNSITQGEQVASVWQPLFERFGIHIDFAHRTFRWDSEASLKAQVHCVIVGFSSAPNSAPRRLYDNDRMQIVENINAYLMDAPDNFIGRRNCPLCDVPEIVRGSQPTDDGNLILTVEERDALVKEEPQAEKYIRPFMMGKDFIQRKPRYCLWLVGANPAELRKCPQIMKRVENVRAFRLKSKKAATRAKAETPMLFDEAHECTSSYVAIPKVSSENRRYIPMDYLPKDIVPGDKLFMMQDAGLYHFGVLTSNVHMAWMRAVCGRLKSDYSYSNTIVYNNFPWPTPTGEQMARIEQTAQAILDARALYPDSSLADLYDELTMPPELRKAHQDNDRAVMQAYGFDVKTTTESSCVAELMKMYQELTQ
jgi:hypothetical protein